MKKQLLGGLALAVAVSLVVAGTGFMPNVGLEENVESGINVNVYKNGELIAQEHNVLMEGEEAIESQIKQATDNYKWDYLALGNGAAPQTGDGTLDSEISTCGLSAEQASVTDEGDGSWKLSNTWTATCDDMDVNTTAQYSNGADTSIDYFSGTDFGRTITMYTDDQLTVEFTNTVS